MSGHPRLRDRITLSYEELAQLTGIGKSTLRRWAGELDMPVCRIGGKVLIVVEDWLAWARSFRELPEVDAEAAARRILSEIRIKGSRWQSR